MRTRLPSSPPLISGFQRNGYAKPSVRPASLQRRWLQTRSRVRRNRYSPLEQRTPLTMTGFRVTRAGAILGVADFAASLRFYRDQLGLEVLALHDDPPYATLTAAGARISLAEQGHPAPDRPGVVMSAPADRSRASVGLASRSTTRTPPMPNSATRACRSWPKSTTRHG